MTRRVPEIVLGLGIATAIWAGVFVWQSWSPSPERPAQAAVVTVDHGQGHYAAGREGHADNHKEKQDRVDHLVEIIGRLWAADLLKASAILTAIFTLGLWYVTYRQMKIANKTLVATQRPRLRIRNVAIIDHIDSQGRPHQIVNGEPILFELYVVNVGGSSAQIIGSHCIPFLTGGYQTYELPPRRPFADVPPNNIIPKITIEPGVAIRVTFESPRVDHDDMRRISGTDTIHSRRLHVVGYVDYRDAIGIVRRTSFCRLYRSKGGPGWFEAVNKEDYESED